MGSSSAKVQNSSPAPTSEFFWLHKSENSILKISEISVTAHPVPKLQIFDNCSVGYTNNSNIVIAGGIKPSGKSTKKVFYVNVQTKSINRLTSLKLPSSNSSLLSFQNTLVLVPATLKSPLQLYASGNWSVLTPTDLFLSHSAVLIHDFILYFLSGTKPNNKPTKKIYSLCLKNPEEYKLTKKITPFKLQSPIIVRLKNSVVVAGGKNNGKNNFFFFIGGLDLEKWKIIQGPEYPLCTPPGVCVKNSAVWVEFPRVVVLNEFFCTVWNIEEEKGKMDEKSVEKNEEKEVTGEKSADFKNEDIELVERKDFLELNCLMEEKVDGDANSDESMLKDQT